MENKNEPITGIIVQEQLAPEKGQALIEGFSGFFAEAKGFVNEGKDLVVSDVEDKEGMQKARELRLRLKDIRVRAESTRKSLKEQSLRESRAIDGVANVLKALTVPVEEHLEAQEKFAELIEAKRKAELLAERVQKISEFTDDHSLYNLADMSDEGFDKLLVGLKSAREAEIEAEKQAEQERIGAERARVEAEKKLREENEKLRKEREAIEAQRQKELKAQQVELAKERAEKERLAQAEAERLRKEQQEADRLKAVEAEKALAPDREKMLSFATELTQINLPAVSTAKARKLVSDVELDLHAIADKIRSTFR